MAIVRQGAPNQGHRMQVWKALITIVGDSWLGYRSMTCWTCEQQLRQSAVPGPGRFLGLTFLECVFGYCS